MTETRYGHTNRSGGNQDQGERKDEGWQSRQGGRQSNEPGRQGDPRPSDQAGGREGASTPPPGTNTQGEMAGIGRASDDTRSELEKMWRRAFPSGADGRRKPESAEVDSERDPGAGTDQPPRMGGPLGPDPEHPHLPGGVQNADTRGSGAGGFDEGVDASRVGTVHQGVKEERSEYE